MFDAHGCYEIFKTVVISLYLLPVPAIVSRGITPYDEVRLRIP
jgi:hypothetical protein